MFLFFVFVSVYLLFGIYLCEFSLKELEHTNMFDIIFKLGHSSLFGLLGSWGMCFMRSLENSRLKLYMIELRRCLSNLQVLRVCEGEEEKSFE